MLPTLSRLSVRYGPSSRLRHWCSSRYLRISLLHLEFRYSLPNSRSTVSTAVLQLSCRISPPTYRSAYAPFTPSKSGQRLPPTYYRGCWHVVSRGFFYGYGQYGMSFHFFIPIKRSSQSYDLHPSRGVAGSPLRALTIFLTAASRRSLDRVSVPVWLIILSDQLSIVALVGRYPYQLANRIQAHLLASQGL